MFFSGLDYMGMLLMQLEYQVPTYKILEMDLLRTIISIDNFLSCMCLCSKSRLQISIITDRININLYCIRVLKFLPITDSDI